MNLLIISQYFWPESFRINDIVRSLSMKGLKIEVLTGKPNYPKGVFYEGYKLLGIHQERYSNSNILRVPIFPRGSKNSLSLFLNYITYIMSALLFGSIYYRKKNFDIIFVYGISPILQAIPALFIGQIKNVPVIIWVQDLWPDSLEATGYIKNKFILKLNKFIVSLIYQKADLLLVQSKAFISPVKSMAAATPVVYYPNSVENFFYSSANTVVPDIPSLHIGFSILFAGNVGAAQAVEVIVEAAYLLKEKKDIRIVILGTGSRWDWMNEQVTSRGLTNLFLEGQYPVETMPGLMRKASALLVSLSDKPIFAATIPNKIQSYLAVGRPILACLNGEGARIVEEAQAGLSVPAEDAVGLASAILRLYEMPVLDREIMGKNGRNYFKEHFDHDKLIDQLISHFESCNKSKKSFQ